MFSEKDFLGLIKTLPSGFSGDALPEKTDFFTETDPKTIQDVRAVDALLTKAYNACTNRCFGDSLSAFQDAAKMACHGYREDRILEFANTFCRSLLSAIDQKKGASLSESLKSRKEREQLAAKQTALFDSIPPLYAAASAKGAKAREDALSVVQGEVGFSDRQPLGTENVHDCVCLALHNPQSHKTALAHIGASVSEDSLDVLLDPLGGKDRPLLARLWGGRYFFDADNCDDTDFSRRNVFLAGRFLERYGIRLVSAEVGTGGKKQRSCCVVEPSTFEMRWERPAARNPDLLVANGLTLLHKPNSRNLHVAFDTTHSSARNPLFVNKTAISNFNGQFDKLSPLEVWTCCQSWQGADSQIAFQALSVLAFQKARALALDPLFSVLRQEPSLPAEVRDTLKENLLGRSLYVGTASAAANAPLLDHLSSTLSAFRADGDACKASQAISSFKFREGASLSAPVEPKGRVRRMSLDEILPSFFGTTP